jgi:hypothetical protein
MNIQDIPASKLRRAATIKEQIERLNRELTSILGEPVRARATGAVKAGSRAKKKRVSPATRAKLRAKLKAYWAAKKAGEK